MRKQRIEYHWFIMEILKIQFFKKNYNLWIEEIGDSELILELFSHELLKYENYNYNNIFDIISKMMKLLEVVIV